MILIFMFYCQLKFHQKTYSIPNICQIVYKILHDTRSIHFKENYLEVATKFLVFMYLI